MGRILVGLVLALVIAVGLVGAYPLVSPRPDAAPNSQVTWRCDATFAADVAGYVQSHDGIDATLVMRGTDLVHAVGRVDLPINTYAMRGAVVSLLYGIAQAERLVDLRARLDKLLAPEEVAALTASQRELRVRDLLEAVSGETTSPRAESDWAVDVLGLIIARATGRGLGALIGEWLAQPTAMQDFLPAHVVTEDPIVAGIPGFSLFLSARDLARLGALFLNDGRWGDVQVVPSAWLDESTTRYSTASDVAPFEGSGYQWWLDEDFDTAWTQGWGGQFMLVDRANELVVVTRNDTGRRVWEIFEFRWRGKHGSYEHHQAIYERALAALADAC